MALRLYNTLSRRLEEFQPLTPPRVGMYVCGPTVYDEPHIGHARSAYVFEVMRRYLKHRKHEVTFVRNITDVDDKIIEKAQATHAAPTAVAEQYTASYHRALEALGLLPPDEEPRATAFIPKMVTFIEGLIKHDAAYAAGGNVYFAVAKQPDYGKLSHRSIDELQTSERGESGEGKRAALDFALWKAAKPGEPSWDSPWGKGRPGWHIECSTMSTALLGETFDIHGGGLDLIFPHHENEIAQSEALTGQPFARYWLHHGLLTTKGQKMSKSLKNFVTVNEALQPYEADVLKLFFLKAHYRSPIDYTEDRMREAQRMLDRFHIAFNAADLLGAGSSEASPSVQRARAQFDQAMDEDINTPEALTALFELVRLIHDGKAAPARQAEVRTAAAAIRLLGSVLGLFERYEPVVLSAAQHQRLADRETARSRRDFSAADQIRRQLEAEGVALEDTPEGTLWRRKR